MPARALTSRPPAQASLRLQYDAALSGIEADAAEQSSPAGATL